MELQFSQATIQDFLQFLGILSENLDPHFNGREFF